jgi:tetratricopeptide (TPR) repeat protein
VLRTLVLVAVMGGVARADFGEQIEGDLFAPPADVAFIIGPPAELIRPLTAAQIEDRSTRFARALERSPHPFVKAQLYLARAEVWGARAVALKRAALMSLDDAHDVELGRALGRAIADYRELYKLKLAGWPSLDRALVSFAYVLGLADQHLEASFLYERVFTEFGDSEHTIRARLALADAALAAKLVPQASQHYEAVATSPYAGSPLRHYALYKAGWLALDERGDARRAYALFGAALELDGDSLLAWELRRGVAKAFALFGAPADAYAAFAQIAPEHALEMLVDLAERWSANARHAETLAVYSELVRRAPRDARACTWQVAATTAASRTKDDVLYVAHLERLVHMFTRMRHQSDDACAEAVSEFTSAFARTVDRALYRRLYDLFLRAFPDRAAAIVR